MAARRIWTQADRAYPAASVAREEFEAGKPVDLYTRQLAGLAGATVVAPDRREVRFADGSRLTIDAISGEWVTV